jgi:hypothetical protein
MSTLAIIVLVVLLLAIFGGLPRWGYHSYGYGPSGLLVFLLIIVIVLAVSGYF